MGLSIDTCLKLKDSVEEECVKKTVSLFALLLVVMVIVVSASLNVRLAKADVDYNIEHISHNVRVLYNGYVFINDTITLNATGLNSFLVGIPDNYSSHVVNCVAYNGLESLPTTRNVPFDHRVGFFGLRVDFPQGSLQTFSVGFMLSNDLLTQDAQNASFYTLDFPAFPSLTKPAAVCNGSIVVPEGAVYLSGNEFNYSEVNLAAFTYNVSSVYFQMVEDKLRVMDFDALKREIRISEFGEIAGADTYTVTNKAPSEVSQLEVFLPSNASNPVAVDLSGRELSGLRLTDQNKSRYAIGLTIPVSADQSTTFTMKYNLPSDFLRKETADGFGLNLSLFQHENYYIKQVYLTLIVPEGAKILNVEGNMADNVYSLGRSVFQETVTVSRQGVTTLEDLNIGITYEYNALWLAFRPTIWVFALSIVGCVVAVVALRRPKVPTKVSAVVTATAKFGPDFLRSFVETYEEKKKILLELESLESRVQKGRIPRRRFKVRSKTLETRLNTLDNNLADAKNRIRAVGGKYAEWMLQLEVAESEISEVAASIKNAEAMHNRGELSLEAYRKRIAAIEHQKEEAGNTINGILLRLREETR
jgi:hypothetical protein